MGALRLTDQQAHVLSILRSLGVVDTHKIGHTLNDFNPRWPHGTYDKAHACLRRLETRGLVKKHAGPYWRITDAGRQALAQQEQR